MKEFLVILAIIGSVAFAITAIAAKTETPEEILAKVPPESVRPFCAELPTGGPLDLLYSDAIKNRVAELHEKTRRQQSTPPSPTNPFRSTSNDLPQGGGGSSALTGQKKTTAEILFEGHATDKPEEQAAFRAFRAEEQKAGRIRSEAEDYLIWFTVNFGKPIIVKPDVLPPGKGTPPIPGTTTLVPGRPSK